MEIIHRQCCEPFVTKDGSEIRELMAYRNSACQRSSLAEATVPPNKTTEAHRHPRTEEIYYVLAGAGRIRLEDEEAEIRPGDAILIPPGTCHQVANPGPDRLVFLCVCVPAYEHEDTAMEECAPTRGGAGP